MNEKRKAYHSIPLCTSAKGEQDSRLTRYDIPVLPPMSRQQTQARSARERTTDAVVMPRPRPPAPAAPAQSFVSHQDMPAVPDDDYRQTHAPKSAWLLDHEGRPVLRQDKKQMVFHQGKPPRRFHWLLYTGVGMAVASLLFMLGSWGVSTWQQNSLNAQYGFPRTYQTDAVVGHSDSAAHPSHFTFENLRGHIIIIELPGGNIAHAHIYGGPTIYTAGGDLVPVTGSFQDVNGDGKPDMVVTIGDGSNKTQIIFLNNGTTFVPEQ